MKISDLEQRISLFSLIEKNHNLQRVGNGVYRVDPCPVCGSKEHFTVYSNTNSYSSYSNCCGGGGVYRYLQEVEGLDERAAYKKLSELAGVEPVQNNFREQIKKAPAAPTARTQGLTNYINSLHDEAIKNYPEEMGNFFLKERMITTNEITKYKLSVFRDQDGLRAMLPVWRGGKVVFYTTRAIEGQEPKYKIAQGMRNEFFNADLLNESQDKPVIIVEGIFDALSLEYAGFNAIAINSLSNVNELKNRIRKSRHAQNTIFLTAFDNDVAGQEAAEKFTYKKVNIPERFNDINDWLKDDVFKLNQGEIKRLTIESNIEKQLETATQPDAVSDYLEEMFYSDIEAMKPYKDKKTGFSNLDKELKGLYPGLYVVGGASSVGKTTFIHQLADQVAEMGEHVIFFSLEQSRMELVSKSIARMTAKNDLNGAASSVSIRNGYKSEPITKALEAYKEPSKRVNVVEGNFNTNAVTIREYVERYREQNNVNPIVIVDYLQIMPAFDERANDKQKTDMNVTELKRMSRDMNLSVFVISSLNRQNYLSPIDFEAFKESGGIEYTADVVLGLQLEVLNNELFDKQNRMKEKREKINEARAENPRQIELVCLKNRNGKPFFKCNFTYWASYDFYEPNKIEDKQEGSKKVTRI